MRISKITFNGAEDATTKEFLEAVSPRMAVISVDETNVWVIRLEKFWKGWKKQG